MTDSGNDRGITWQREYCKPCIRSSTGANDTGHIAHVTYTRLVTGKIT